jgi:hypothetical protein
MKFNKLILTIAIYLVLLAYTTCGKVRNCWQKCKQKCIGWEYTTAKTYNFNGQTGEELVCNCFWNNNNEGVQVYFFYKLLEGTGLERNCEKVLSEKEQTFVQKESTKTTLKDDVEVMIEIPTGKEGGDTLALLRAKLA